MIDYKANRSAVRGTSGVHGYQGRENLMIGSNQRDIYQRPRRSYRGRGGIDLADMGRWNGLILLLLASTSSSSENLVVASSEKLVVGMLGKEGGEALEVNGPIVRILPQSQESILYPYGLAHKDQTTTVEDDGGTDKIHIRNTFKYFGVNHRYLYVNNNGGISFNEPVTQYTPDAFPIPGISIIAPYWADVDNELGGMVYYSERVDDFTLDRITDDMKRYFPDLHFKAVWSFIVTWDEVAFYGSESDKVNTFQAVLTTDNHRSIVIFNYGDLQWTTGTASGGDPKTGLGGTTAQAGFNTDGHHFSIPSSRTDHVLNIKSSSNVGTPGRWIFQVDDFKVPGGCVFEASFMQFGQSVWKDEECKSKCTCRHDGKMDCDPLPCAEGLVCVPAGRHFMCQIDEEDC
ncbi:alpha-tectorin-like [Spea bombifrons]|uniref:alpha-tectorin-like n=1 Tax=Spea bombifrons TaxID=233779 RepID=UPI00234A6E6A|nr:alpha-tectorin-like [Spea bombifrons]